MKKHLFTIAAVAFALCACQKAETGTNEVTPGVNEEVGAPQQILIGTNLKSSELLTKASVDFWNGQTVYVIGYDNAKIVTATEVSEGDVFIMPNIPGIVPENAAYSEEALKGELDFGETKFYYDEDVKSYDFVGYYLGEGVEKAAGDITVGNGIMTVDFEIDGTQDVLAAITDIDNDRKFYDEEAGTWKAVKTDYVYSAFAARRGVKPTLKFNHMLTKFSFNVTYGSDEGAQDFKLESISLGTYTAGTLTLNPEGRVTPFVTPTGENEGTVILVPEVEFTAKGDTEEAGYLMVLPGKAEYQMTLVYSQDNTDDQDHDYSIPIEIGKVTWNENVPEEVKNAGKFLPGKHYVVNVTVYGLEKIEVNVELVPWDEVGSVVIDPDDPEGKIEEVAPES